MGRCCFEVSFRVVVDSLVMLLEMCMAVDWGDLLGVLTCVVLVIVPDAGGLLHHVGLVAHLEEVDPCRLYVASL